MHTVTVLWLPYILVSVFSIRYAVGKSRKMEALSTCLFKHYAMRAYRGSNRQLHPFLTSALHQLHAPTVLSRNKNDQQPISRRLLASQQVWTVARRWNCLSTATAYGTSDSCEYPTPISQDLMPISEHLTANSQHLTQNTQHKL